MIYQLEIAALGRPSIQWWRNNAQNEDPPMVMPFSTRNSRQNLQLLMEIESDQTEWGAPSRVHTHRRPATAAILSLNAMEKSKSLDPNIRIHHNGNNSIPNNKTKLPYSINNQHFLAILTSDWSPSHPRQYPTTCTISQSILVELCNKGTFESTLRFYIIKNTQNGMEYSKYTRVI